MSVGYNHLGESGIVDSPEANEKQLIHFSLQQIFLALEFLLLIMRQVYNTVQIYSQCWFKENLNVGEMIPASQSETNNKYVQKYCPLDNEYYCNTFAGALYQWARNDELYQ